jgi:hypothetical protein
MGQAWIVKLLILRLIPWPSPSLPSGAYQLPEPSGTAWISSLEAPGETDAKAHHHRMGLVPEP